MIQGARADSGLSAAANIQRHIVALPVVDGFDNPLP
jgi:hypothetical protein